MGCGYMTGVFVSEPRDMSSLSNSPNKVCIVHVILPITVTWRKVDEPILKTPFFYLAKKKKRTRLHCGKILIISLCFFFFSFLRTIDIIFCLAPIHASEQRQKIKKKLEMVKNHEFQSQKG